MPAGPGAVRLLGVLLDAMGPRRVGLLALCVIIFLSALAATGLPLGECRCRGGEYNWSPCREQFAAAAAAATEIRAVRGLLALAMLHVAFCATSPRQQPIRAATASAVSAQAGRLLGAAAAGRKMIVVTGGTGFLGSVIVRQLVHRGYSVGVIDRVLPSDERRVAGAEYIVADLAWNAFETSNGLKTTQDLVYTFLKHARAVIHAAGCVRSKLQYTCRFLLKFTLVRGNFYISSAF